MLFLPVAPMLPSLGYADAFRTGAVSDRPRSGSTTRVSALNPCHHGRSWQNGIWWWNDPDQNPLRHPSKDTVHGSIVANLISGQRLIGDDLRSVEREKLDWRCARYPAALGPGTTGKPVITQRG